MHELKLHNTLSGKTELFVPQVAGEVKMYTCGPTVYDYAHVGNFRTFVFQDTLRRYLKQRGLKLNHVMNLTDVDDRIIANAAAAKVGILAFSLLHCVQVASGDALSSSLLSLMRTLCHLQIHFPIFLLSLPSPTSISSSSPLSLCIEYKSLLSI